MADLQINYDRLHELANDARSLKDHLDDTVPGLDTGVSGVNSRAEAIGSSKLASSLTKFRYAWDKPFSDAMDRLGDLATLLDSVATKFFDMDADFAQKAASVLSQQTMSDWKQKDAEYQDYLAKKDKMFTPFPLYNAEGVLENQEPVHLFKYGNGPGESPIPEDPGAMPDVSDYELDSSGGQTRTDTQYDDNGRVTTETSTIGSASGLGYTQTTEYTYDGDSEDPSSSKTTITHSDGTIDTLNTTYHDDGSYVIDGKTVDPSNDDNNTSSVTTVTPHTETVDGKTVDHGYTSVSVDQDDKKTTTEVVNNDGSDNDTKKVTDDDGTVREYKGNYDSDSWEQTSGPSEYEDD
ncbi:hypothetical protein KIH74_25420 [Kineosporia sp. J2-2]|uniref:Proteins of 100 residues with WXG n=1 Tax=Kineosporia corallincola TaxID=2835133 RepID=A0ABS5TMH4_9ACTN|nr:hypothetical protein [Kineosporia corallincola]MBT0772310.1 hypothetical protein [Kineosporia corallincola]